MLSPSEQLLYNSVRITALAGDAPIQHGTGFFWRTQVGSSYVDTLITNKHVLQGADAIRIRCHVSKKDVAEPSGRTTSVKLILDQGGIVHHPEPDVDLCCVSASGLAGYGKHAGGDALFYVTIEGGLIPTEDEWGSLDAIEEIVMVGCPNGLFDEANGLPITRRGITASHPAFRYAGKDQFMIDAACFPGSSGSPVFLYNMSSYYNKVEGSFSIGTPRLKLLGVLFAGPTIDQQGRIVLTVAPRIEVSGMMHLGYVVRSTRLQEIDARIRERAVFQPV